MNHMHRQIESVLYVQWHMQDDKHDYICSHDIELLRMLFYNDYIYDDKQGPHHDIYLPTRNQECLHHLLLFVKFQLREAEGDEMKFK